MTLTSAEARTLSKWFLDLSAELRNYRTTKWNNLDGEQRQRLKDAAEELLNASSELSTAAVGLTLDESEISFDALKESSERAKEAIKTLQTVGKVINVATAAVGLAAAIASKDVGAIGKNAKSLHNAATAGIA